MSLVQCTVLFDHQLPWLYGCSRACNVNLSLMYGSLTSYKGVFLWRMAFNFLLPTRAADFSHIGIFHCRTPTFNLLHTVVLPRVIVLLLLCMVDSIVDLSRTNNMFFLHMVDLCPAQYANSSTGIVCFSDCMLCSCWRDPSSRTTYRQPPVCMVCFSYYCAVN